MSFIQRRPADPSYPANSSNRIAQTTQQDKKSSPKGSLTSSLSENTSRDVAVLPNATAAASQVIREAITTNKKSADSASPHETHVIKQESLSTASKNKEVREGMSSTIARLFSKFVSYFAFPSFPKIISAQKEEAIANVLSHDTKETRANFAALLKKGSMCTDNWASQRADGLIREAYGKRAFETLGKIQSGDNSENNRAQLKGDLIKAMPRLAVEDSEDTQKKSDLADEIITSLLDKTIPPNYTANLKKDITDDKWPTTSDKVKSLISEARIRMAFDSLDKTQTDGTTLTKFEKKTLETVQEIYTDLEKEMPRLEADDTKNNQKKSELSRLIVGFLLDEKVPLEHKADLKKEILQGKWPTKILDELAKKHEAERSKTVLTASPINKDETHILDSSNISTWIDIEAS